MRKFRPFFDYARARHEIYLKRASGKPRPWTQDPILQQYKFTNVFRELDKNTVWYAKNVRTHYSKEPALLLLATVLFRMTNRISTGEAMFLQRDLVTGESAFDAYAMTGDVRHLRRAVLNYVGKTGPYITGAYTVSSPPGKNKLDGVLWIVDNFRKSRVYFPGEGDEGVASSGELSPAEVAQLLTEFDAHHLEDVFTWLSGFPFLGTFHSYEIVTDLRHTALLNKAPDINTWANVGPGAWRGLNRLHGRRKVDSTGRDAWGARMPAEQALEEMQELLAASNDKQFWPARAHEPDWPRWELRDVEHTLCEFDKYERVRNGEGAPRGRFG